MDALARREHSRLELNQKLRDAGFPEETVLSTLDRLADERLQCDERFVEVFISSRFRQGKGPVRIRSELSQRGVSAAMVEAVLRTANFDWYALACRVRESKFGADPIADFKERARQMRFLSYRGFNTDQIQSACGDR